MASPQRPLTALLESLAAGREPLAAELTALSGLAPEETVQLARVWPRIPLDTRESILVRATNLAEDNVDLDFSELARTGLDDPEARVRRRAIDALWENQDRATGRRLAQLLRDDPDEQVRAGAAAALGEFVLQRELESFPAHDGDELVNALRAVVDDVSEPVDVRAGALESLGFRSLPWVDTAINGAYYDDDRRLRLAAITAMGRSAQEKWIDDLAEDARSDDPEFRFYVAQALGALGSEDGVEALAELLGDEDHEVLLAALAALGEIGGEEAVRLLREFAQDPPPELEEAVQAALDNALFVGQERGNEFPAL